MKKNFFYYCFAFYLLNCNSAFAEQLIYKCKYSAGFTEYTVDASANVVREYIPQFQHTKIFPLQFISPEKIVWKSTIESNSSKYHTLYELNRKTLELKEYSSMCDFASGKCTSPVFKIKCYKSS